MSDIENGDESDLREQLRLSQEALQRSEQFALAGRYAGAIMHEINNPLEAITNLVYLAKLVAHDPEKVKCYIQQAEEQLNLVRRIARQTLSFYREQRRAHEVDVVELLESALRIHTRYLLDKQVEIQRRLPETLVIQGNSGELLQVLSNLIVNALEALSPRGRLYLRARSANEEVHITVADNGCGIPEALRGHLFVPFHTNKGESGTGLGLWLSKTLVEKYLGRIRWRTSARAGRSGTTFRISLATSQPLRRSANELTVG
jgi:C4-dicarboxylate-specific signal transduction histidine kinase